MTFVLPPPAPPKAKKKITLTAANKVEIPAALMKASAQLKAAPNEEKRIGYDNDQMMTKADFQRRYKNDPKGWEWYWAAGIGEQPPEYKRKAPNGKFYAQKDFQKLFEKALEDALSSGDASDIAVANANKKNWLQLWEQAEKAANPIPVSKCPPGCISLRKANQLIAERKIIDPDLYVDPVADKAAELEARLLANGGKLVGNYKNFEDDLDNAEDLREVAEGDDWLDDDLYADINAPTPPKSGQGSSSGASATPKSGPSTIGGPSSSVGTPATPKSSSKAGSPPKMQSKTPHRPVLASPVKPKTPPQPVPMAALTLDPPGDQYDYGTWVGKTNALVHNAAPSPLPSPAMLTPALATPSSIPSPFQTTAATFSPVGPRPSPGPPSAAMALLQLGKQSPPRPAQSAKKQSPPRPAQPGPAAGQSLWMQTLNMAKQQNLASFEYRTKDGARVTYVRAPVDPKRPNFITYVRADGKKPSRSACAGLAQIDCSGDCKWAANAKTPHCRTAPKKKSPKKKASPPKKKASPPKKKASPTKKKASPTKKKASPVNLVTPPKKNKNSFFVDLDDDL